MYEDPGIYNGSVTLSMSRSTSRALRGQDEIAILLGHVIVVIKWYEDPGSCRRATTP